MADSSIPITGGAGYNVDTRTTTNGDHREVVALGDATTDSVAKVNTYGDLSVSLTSPTQPGAYAKFMGESLKVDPFQYSPVFMDSFEGTTIDPNQWISSGTVPASLSSGAITIAPGTANSASTVLSQNPGAGLLAPVGSDFLAITISLEAARLTSPNVHRFWGKGQVNSYTSATPLTEGMGFEIDLTGNLNVVYYVSGTRYVINSTDQSLISSSVSGLAGSGTALPIDAHGNNFGQLLTWPGGLHRYAANLRPELGLFYIETFDVPVALVEYLMLNVQVLPVRLAAITAPPTSTIQSASFTTQAIMLADTFKPSSQISDGAYPARKVQVGKSGGLSVKGAIVLGATAAFGAAATGTAGPVDVSDAGNASIIVRSTTPAVPYTGTPVLVFEQSDDSVSWSPMAVVRSDSGLLATTHTLGAGVANGSVIFDSVLGGGINWMRVRVTTGTTANGITVVIQPGGLAFTNRVSVITPPDVRVLAQSIAATSGNAVSSPALNGQGTLAVQITGTWSATLTFEATLDGVTWVPLSAVQIGSTNQGTSTTTSNGMWHVTVAGFAGMRVRCSTTGTGTVVISLSATAAPGALDQVGLWRPDSVTRVALDATTVFTDTFETLNTADMWTLGGTSPTVASGQVSYPTGTAASATSWMRSQPAFTLLAGAFENVTMIVQFEAAVLTGNKAWWGLGVPQASPTVAAPMLNGVVFEILDTDGLLYGAVYSGGTRVQSVALARPNDAAQHRYAIYNKTSRTYFEIDNLVVGSIALPNTQVSSLPLTIGSVNGASVLGTARTLNATLAGLGDTGRNATQLADGTFAWRKAQIGKSGGLAVRGAQITTTSAAFGAAATGIVGPLDVSEAGNVTFVIKNTIAATAWTGSPALTFEQSDDSVSWAALTVVRGDTSTVASSVQVGAGVANTSLMYDAALEGVNYVRVRVTVGPVANSLTVLIQPGGHPFSPIVTTQPAAPPFITGAGPSSVTAAITDTLLLAANAQRRGMTVYNDSTAVLFLSLGFATASATAFTIKIPAAGYYELPFLYTGMIRGLWAAANGAARITEVAMS